MLNRTKPSPKSSGFFSNYREWPWWKWALVFLAASIVIAASVYTGLFVGALVGGAITGLIAGSTSAPALASAAWATVTLIFNITWLLITVGVFATVLGGIGVFIMNDSSPPPPKLATNHVNHDHVVTLSSTNNPAKVFHSDPVDAQLSKIKSGKPLDFAPVVIPSSNTPLTPHPLQKAWR